MPSDKLCSRLPIEIYRDLEQSDVQSRNRTFAVLRPQMQPAELRARIFAISYTERDCNKLSMV